MKSMTGTLLTADEYIATSDARPRWTQLVNGEVIMNNPTIRHQKIVSFLHFQLMLWINAGRRRGESPGQIDVKLDSANVVAPDVAWYSEGRLPTDGTHIEFPPDIVVEVRSPSTWRYDTTTKFRQYESAGVAEVWLVDTAAHTVLVFRRSSASTVEFDTALELGAGDELTSPLLDGFAVPIQDIFNR
jgi:Uma2 family endonuclease